MNEMIPDHDVCVNDMMMMLAFNALHACGSGREKK